MNEVKINPCQSGMTSIPDTVQLCQKHTLCTTFYLNHRHDMNPFSVPAALKGRPTQTCRTTNITSECKHRNWLSCRGQTKTDTRGGATCQLNHSVGSLSATCRAENGMASKSSPNPSGVKASLVLNQPRLLTVLSVVRSEKSSVCVCVRVLRC